MRYNKDGKPLISVGIIMLSNASTDKHYEMTCNALKSLYDSEDKSLFDFETVVIEGNKDKDYKNVLTEEENVFGATLYTYHPSKTEFNYNKFLNHGFGCLFDKDDEEYYNPEDVFNYYVICNNDIIFEKNWFTEMHNAFLMKPQLSSASPFCPDYSLHESFTNDVNYGYRTSIEMCGWCIVFKRSILEQVTPFDERFKFYYQDNDYAMVLQSKGLLHALIKNSHVRHLFSQSHDLITPSFYNDFTDGAGKIFKEKWFK